MKRVFCQTYILYDKSGMVNPTFVSELQQYVNSFPQVIIFCGKSDKNLKNFAEKQQFFFQLKKNCTGGKRFILVLRKLDGSSAKIFLKEISIEFLIKPDKAEEKKIYDKLSVVDILVVLGIQDLIQLTTLNPVFVDISTSPPHTSFVNKYPLKSLCTGSV